MNVYQTNAQAAIAEVLARVKTHDRLFASNAANMSALTHMVRSIVDPDPEPPVEPEPEA